MIKIGSVTLYSDRVPIGFLINRAPAVVEEMRRWGIGKIDQQKKVSFCGIVYSRSEGPSVFLPLGMPMDLRAARLTMDVLSRFGAESGRGVSDQAGVGNSGALSIVSRLAMDFKVNGIYSEQQRIRSRNIGKPDWKRTVIRERPIYQKGKGDIFLNIVTTKMVGSNETILAQVQAVVLSEIIECHGWWIDGIRTRQSELRRVGLPRLPRAFWPAMLEDLLPRLYSERAIRLTKLLISFLRNSAASKEGNLVIGVDDFHTVWEAMLRATLVHVVPSWNSKLPLAVYTTVSGTDDDAPERRMLTDIILEDEGRFTIVDAKYYLAASSTSVPGWPDIAKQMFYEMALRSVLGPSADVKNYFVFPAETAVGIYSKVAVKSRKDGAVVSGFPTIDCKYLSIDTVMQAYRAGENSLVLI